MKDIISALWLSLLFFSACGPLYIYNIKTQEDEFVYYKGREIITKQNEGVSITINYEDQVNYDMIFNLSVINNSNSCLFFDPSLIYIELLKEYSKVIPDSEVVKLNAVDPESKIKSLRNQIHNSNANRGITQTFNILSDVVELGKDVSEIGKKKTQEEIAKESLEEMEKNQYRAEEEVNFHNNITALVNSLDYWTDAAFRKTTIFPGESMTGFVHLPLLEEARIFRVTIPVNYTTFTFLFESKPIRNYK